MIGTGRVVSVAFGKKRRFIGFRILYAATIFRTPSQTFDILAKMWYNWGIILRDAQKQEVRACVTLYIMVG